MYVAFDTGIWLCILHRYHILLGRSIIKYHCVFELMALLPLAVISLNKEREKAVDCF